MEQRFLKKIDELTSILKESNVRSLMLVCTHSFLNLKEYVNLKKSVNRAGVEIVEFTDFEPNPKYDSAVNGLRIFEDRECTFIIAAGGGSAIDVAKFIKVYAGLDGDKIYLGQEIKHNGIEMLAVPTTAGTGSESTRFAVIYYEGEKKSVNHATVLPEYVWLESETIFSLPEYQKKCTMMDAFCHAVESMWSMRSTEESKEYSKKSISLILSNKDAYLENNASAVKNMMIASNYAGRAINIATTTAGHAMCYKITSLYNFPHGHAAVICLPKLWRYMLTHMGQCRDNRGEYYLNNTFLEIANAMGKDSVSDAIEYIEKLIGDLGLKAPKLKSEEEIELLVKSVNVERLENNPVMLSGNDLRNIYEEIFRGSH